MRATRAYLAGFGTAGSLLAGGALLFVMASAVVSFRGWPSVTAQAQPVAIVQQARTPSAGAVRRVALVAAKVKTVAPRPTVHPIVRVAPAARVATPHVSVSQPQAPSHAGQSQHHRTPAVTPSPPPTPPSKPAAPAKCATASCAVHTVGAALGTTAAVATNGLGTTVSTVGNALGALVSGVTGGLGSKLGNLSPGLGKTVTAVGAGLGQTVTNATTVLGNTLVGTGRVLGGALGALTR